MSTINFSRNLVKKTSSYNEGLFLPSDFVKDAFYMENKLEKMISFERHSTENLPALADFEKKTSVFFSENPY